MKRLTAPSAMLLIVCVTLASWVMPAIGADSQELDRILAEETSPYAYGKEGVIIRHALGDQSDGFFLDVGAYEWKKMSTTLYLEKHLGWSGFAVDALTQYEAGWKKNRPRSRFFAFAVTDRSGETVTFHRADGTAGGVSSTEDWAVDHWRKAKGVKSTEIAVPTITLSDLLDREGIEHIDFLSMDINGGEPLALAGFDIKRFRPKLVLVEAHERNKGALTDYFEKNEYVQLERYLAYDRVNWYFAPIGDDGNAQPTKIAIIAGALVIVIVLILLSWRRKAARA